MVVEESVVVTYVSEGVDEYVRPSGNNYFSSFQQVRAIIAAALVSLTPIASRLL